MNIQYDAGMFHATTLLAFAGDHRDARITHTSVRQAVDALRSREPVVVDSPETAVLVLIAVGLTEEAAQQRVHFALTGRLNIYNGSVLVA